MLKRIAILLLLVNSPAHASGVIEKIIASSVPSAVVRGEATMRWFGLPLYDATLFTQNAEPLDWRDPLALRLTYARTIKREAFMKATINELTRIEGKQSDHPEIARKLEPCFKTANSGDSFVATAENLDELRLWFNNRLTCSISHPDIKQRFLNIWLSDQSRSPKLTKKLRGE